MDVNPGASSARISSGNPCQKASPSFDAPSGRRRCWSWEPLAEVASPSSACSTSSARTEAGRHSTCTRISCAAIAAASSMSTSTAPRTVRAMCSHSSVEASSVPEAAPDSFSVDAIGRSMRPGSTAPSSPRHAAASRWTRNDNAVLFSETQHFKSAATSRPTTSAVVVAA